MGPVLKVFEAVGLRWSLSLFISGKFPGNADAAGMGTTLRELLS